MGKREESNFKLPTIIIYMYVHGSKMKTNDSKSFVGMVTTTH